MKTQVSILALGAMLAMGAPSAMAQDCKPAHTFETITKGTLTVVSYEIPPFLVLGPDKSFDGVDGDMVKAIAEKECLTLKTVVADAGANIQYVISRRADLAIGNWYRTAKRDEVVGLSTPTYVDQVGMVTKEGAKTLSALEGKKFGTVQGYLWVDDLKAVFGDNLILYPDPVAMAQDLAGGRLDAAADSYSSSVAAQQRGAYKGFKVELMEPDERVKTSLRPAQSAFIYEKSNSALGKAIDADIEEMRASGELGKILVKYGLDPSVADVGEPWLVK